MREGKMDAAIRSQARRMSAKANPSRTTVSPTSTASGCANIGPAVTQEWNSPCSPHGSTAAGRSASSAVVEGAAGERRVEHSRIDGAEARASGRRSTICARQGRGRRRLPQREERRQAGACEPLLAVAPHVLEEQIAEGHVREAVGHEPGRRRRAIRRSYSSLLHGHGSGTTWSGSPAARACASSTSRRTPCIATRSKASLVVVSRPPHGARMRRCAARAASTPSPCRSTTRPGSSSPARMQSRRQPLDGIGDARSGHDQAIAGHDDHAAGLDGRHRRQPAPRTSAHWPYPRPSSRVVRALRG